MDVSERRLTGDWLYLNDMYAFDMSSRQWIEIACRDQTSEHSDERGLVIPCERSGHSAVVHNKRIIIFGGVHQQNNDKHLNDIYEFDTSVMEWRCVRASGIHPQPRRRHSCHIVHGQMFVFAGSGPYTANYRLLESINSTQVFLNSKYFKIKKITE